MKIQIISNKQSIKCFEYEIKYSKFSEPKTLDSFDINIVDLQDENLWRNRDDNALDIVYSADWKLIKKNIETSKKTNIIIAFPQNYKFLFNYYADSYYEDERYHKTVNLKNATDILKEILKNIIPCKMSDGCFVNNFDIGYENAETICGKSVFKSVFYFYEYFPSVEKTTAKDSGKATTIYLTDRCYLTTLFLSDDNCNLIDFLTVLGVKEKGHAEVPEWIKSANFFNDIEQINEINKNSVIIEKAQAEIDKANKILDNNLYYKSVLYETGDNLVKVVTEMLGKLYNYDMSKFVDKKDEDFRIVLEDKVFLGEIKGINTNVKKANVSQVLQHTSSFEDDNKNLLVKGLLIINHQRDKTLEERENINSDIIKFATKNDVLIIPTIDLLKIFEKFVAGKVISEKVIEQFTNQSGLIDIGKIIG